MQFWMRVCACVVVCLHAASRVACVCAVKLKYICVPAELRFLFS